METNTHATASVGESNCHELASIKPLHPVLLKLVARIDIKPLLKNERGHYIKSQLAGSMEGRLTLLHFNEASACYHVTNLLTDVLKCLRLSDTTCVGQEMSLFSIRPDTVVVRFKSSIVLVIEVKNPGNGVLENETAAGQVLDYLMGMRHMGNNEPIACLSTYEEMRICALSDSTAVFEEATDRLNRLSFTEDKDRKPTNQSTKKEPTSPQESNRLAMIIPKDSSSSEPSDGTSNGSTTEGITREVYFSETFGREKMFEALCWAVMCGILAVEMSANIEGRGTSLIPKEGEEVDKYVAVIGKQSLQWKLLKCRAAYGLKVAWHHTWVSYFHCVLGK